MIQKALTLFDPSEYDPSTVIGEFSGRDSVAAILKAFEDEHVTHILPVATFAGTEFGDFNTIYENYIQLRHRIEALYGSEKTLYPLLEYSREDIWAIMNGRPANALRDKYGFYSHCIGCHLYFHLTKLVMAKPLSGIILSGERESHDGRIKVNQLGETLDTYIRVINGFGCELRMPLRHMKSGDEVERLIGWDWKEGLAHPACVLSGNYRDASGRAVYDHSALTRLLEDYIEPAGRLIGAYLLDEKGDIKQLKEEVLGLL